MYCKKCGHPIPYGAPCCAKCGAAQPTPQAGAGLCAPQNRNANTALIAVLAGLILVALFLAALIVLNVFSPGPAEKPHATKSSVIALAPSAAPESAPPARTQKPSEAPTRTPAPSPAQTAKPLPGLNIPEEELLAYFCEIALNSEYGGSDNGIVKKWEEPIKVEISGDYTQQDYDFLLKHIAMLNGMGCLPPISAVKTGGNYFVHFVPLDDMPEVVPGYVEGNWGYINPIWGEDFKIANAYMGVAIDVTTQKERNHLILEEFTQGLGLVNDSYQYSDSIFQQEWTEIQELSALDLHIIAMLYSPLVKPGMNQAEVEKTLKRWLKSKNQT